MSSFCNAKATHIFFSKKFQHICVSLNVNFNESLTNDINVNFNESLTNDIVSFDQLGPVFYDLVSSRVNPFSLEHLDFCKHLDPYEMAHN